MSKADIMALPPKWRFGRRRLSCVVYQAGGGYAGGHIALADVTATSLRHAGTGWYKNWPIQRYYCKFR